MMLPTRRTRRRAALMAAAALLLTEAAVSVGPAAGTDPLPSLPAPAPGADRVTLLTHDSFALTPEVFAGFEARTGYAIDVLTGGDAGTVVNQAILAGDHPIADVLYGVDNTFLSRALDAGIFEPYRPAGLADVPLALQLDAGGRVTPIDYGDVCVNTDLSAFGGAGEPPLPVTLDDLVDPAYRGMLVVQDPAVSSPGLAFLFATIARYGDEGETTWRDYWIALRANDVLVAPDWTEAYFGRFSGGANEGDRPMVVSYASSPVAEVIYADPRPDTPPTGVLLDGCFRQVEFAGVLAGSPRPEVARALVDFLLSPTVQSDIPLNMFVSPALSTAELPADWVAFNATPDAPLALDPALIDANREAWIEEWTQLVLR